MSFSTRVVDFRPDRDEHDLGREGRLDLVEERRPRERSPVDQGVRLSRRGDDDFELGLVDALSRLPGPVGKVRSRPAIVANLRGEAGVLPRQAHDFGDVEDGQRQDDKAKHAERHVHGALVVERTRGEIGAQHYAPSA